MIRPGTIEKHIGSRYGRLVIVSYARREGHHDFYNCRCDCGNERQIRIWALRSKYGRTFSCGCYGREKRLAANIGNTYRRLPKGQAAFGLLYNGYRNDARRRGYAFELTKEEFAVLTSSNCFYCGTEPSGVRSTTQGNGAYIFNGVDRVDNSKGYISSNSVPCCKECNSKKNGVTREMVEKIYHFLCKT